MPRSPQKSYANNVLVKGLWSPTTDASVRGLAAPFGPVTSVKTFKHGDIGTGTAYICMGSPQAAKQLILWARSVGLQAELANPPSHQLFHSLADRTTTNLYLSHFSKDWSEEELANSLFPSPCVVESSRILRDDLPGASSSPQRGHSRGVGFVRLQTRQQAELAIQHLNGRYIQGQPQPLQVRFADSEQQKSLKRSGWNCFKSVVLDRTPSAAPESASAQFVNEEALVERPFQTPAIVQNAFTPAQESPHLKLPTPSTALSSILQSSDSRQRAWPSQSQSAPPSPTKCSPSLPRRRIHSSCGTAFKLGRQSTSTPEV